ncbi:MAG: DUF4097 family beta strand repeat-containing protein [Balneolaceae bacterium]
MKSFKIIPDVLVTAFFSAIMSLFLFTTAEAQNQIAVPLSNPNQSGELHLSMIRGSLQVSGYDGEEVIINYDNGQAEDREPENEASRDGLRRLSSNSLGFEVTERENRVNINNVSPMREIDFDIRVPENFSMKISIVHGNSFLVENVNGDLEINHVNGEVELTNIGGSALVNTVNGDIKATFRSVAEGKPMAFSNVNGDIDVTLPASANLTAKMKSEWGDMFTDFDMTMQQGEDVSRGSTSSGGYQVSVNNWLIGEINGGGPEYLFKTLHGDIYIRKR